jgi:hypothetical protein
MWVVLIVVLVIITAMLLLRAAGSNESTSKVMLVAYHAVREKYPDISDREVLLKVLKLRPPFSTYSESALMGIVDMCPEIEALTAFVIGFDSAERKRKIEGV